jgi:Domain of unknown function (DUF4386)
MQAYYLMRIRVGVLIFLLGGLLLIVATLLRGPFVDPVADHTGFARLVTAPLFVPAAAGFLISLVLQLFGLMALYAFLANSTVERLMLVGLILTTVTYALLLAVVGTFAFIFPIVGNLYLQGQTSAINVAVTFETSFMVVLVLQAILFSIATLVTSVAIWRSGTLPRWSALTYALAGLILAFAPPLPFVPEVLGTVLLTISIGGIAWSVWQQTDMRREMVQTRVQ